MADGETKRAFRQLEKELDTIHQGLPFFRVPMSCAAYSLLAAFDGFYIVDAGIFEAMSGEIDIGSTQFRKKFEDGLSQALRWMVNDPSTFDSEPTNDASMINEAGEFILHAGDYYNLADFHAMFGRGLLDVSVDLTEKKVRFIAPPDQTVQQAMTGCAEIVENLKNLPFVRRPQDLIRLECQASHALRSLDHEFINGRVVLKDTNQLADPTIIALCELFRHEFVDIDPNTDLGGFTIDQFQAYWSVLARWSHSVVGVFFERVASGVSQNECMPTQCVPKADFFSSVRNLSGLDEGTVSLITDCLSWGPTIANPDIFLQPLICGPNTVLWSPRLIDISRYPRNLLKLLAKKKGVAKQVVDNIIGSREIPAIRRLAEHVASKSRTGWQFKLRRKVVAGGEEGEIDYLGWNAACREEVLLIEYKATLDVDEINEVDSGTLEMLKGQNQLERCLRILSKLSAAEKKSLYPFVPWHSVTRIYGIVVSSGCEPNEKYNHSEIPGISADAFFSRIPKRDFVRPSRLWQSCRTRQWLAYLNDFVRTEEEVKIGPLTYYIPSITSRSDPGEYPRSVAEL